MEFSNITYRHRIPVQLRFNDVDRFGHVNNTVYFSLYDLGKAEYLHAVLDARFEQQDVVPVVANINADFLHPIFYGDPVVIETATVRLGHKSFTLHQRAVNTATGAVLCQCSTTMVCFSLSAGETVDIPVGVRAAIERYERGDGSGS